jgi:hypothetical protein
MPQDRGSRTPSLVFPILLIVVGALFLYSTWRPAFDPWPILATYWPLILIFVGLGMMWDASRRGTVQSGSSRFPVGSTVGILAFAIVLVVLVLHGRQVSRSFGDLGQKQEHSSKIVDLQNAKSVYASIEMGAGQLNISGGAAHLLESEFNFSSSWEQPSIQYQVTNGSGELSIKQESSGPHIGRTNNSWTLNFSNDVPLELKIDLGAGQSNLKLRGLNLNRLTVDMGAGETNVDLTGPRNSDLTADIEGGVGQATIRLPKDIGVIATASGGIGSIRAPGLTEEGDQYKNDAYGKSPHTIHLRVEGGIGQINLEQEP